MNRRIQYGFFTLLGLVAGLSICGLIYHIWGKRPLSPADMVLSAPALTDAYDNGEGHADSLYLYKKLSVKGTLYRLHKNESGQYVATLEGRYPGRTAVDCILDSLYSPTPPDLRRGDTLVIRGRCSGRSLNVILVQCIIEK
jgi:putative nucleic acid binding protein